MHSGLLLAIHGNWSALREALRSDPQLIATQDANAMTVLHWACLHASVPSDVIMQILWADPTIASRETIAGLLAVDLAEQAGCRPAILEMLHAMEPQDSLVNASVSNGAEELKAEYPIHDAEPTEKAEKTPALEVVEGTDAGLHLAKIGAVEPKRLAYAYRSMSDVPLSSDRPGKPLPTKEKTEENRANQFVFRSISMVQNPSASKASDLVSCMSDSRHSFDSRDSIMDAKQATTRNHMHTVRDNRSSMRKSKIFPPRWKQAHVCSVCAMSFSIVRRRHHCRNCGQSVCGPHSTHRVALLAYGLMDPQRICDKCFFSGRHLVSQEDEPSRS